MRRKSLSQREVGDLTELAMQSTLIVRGVNVNISCENNSRVQREEQNAQKAYSLHIFDDYR